MAEGIKIAKPGASINSSSDKIYVDSTTPLLKVKIAASGSMISDGVSRQMQWTGKYIGKTNDDSSGYFFYIKIPHELDYVPMSIAYMDRNPGANRQFLTSIQAGLGSQGKINAFAFCDNKNLTIEAAPNLATVPAGTYNYFFYIFYDRVSP